MEVIRLDWQGPYAIHTDWRIQFKQADDFAGVYAFSGGHYGYDSSVLLYIGKSDNGVFKRHFGEDANSEWLDRMSCHLGAKFFAAKFDGDKDTRMDVESVLIHVHQPHYNSREIVTPRTLRAQLLIYNQGSIPPHLLPVIATDYPWFGKERPFLIASELQPPR